MPKCARCGKPRGWLYSLCPECIARGNDERAQPLSAESPVTMPSGGGASVDVDSAAAPGAAAPIVARYATFPRRLNAISADTIVLVLFSMALFALLPFVQRLPAVRLTLMVGWWVTLLFYEPVSVSCFGGTPGHRLLNLRVVDDRTGRNLGIGKAVARFWIKGLLGVFSFFTMNFSRRHRALHDLATGSTVQIRDATRALPHHYVLGDAPEAATRAT